MYDNKKCILCGGKFCNCGKGNRCKCQKSSTNEDMKKVLTVLGVPPSKYRFGSQDDKTKEVIQYMVDTYTSKGKKIEAIKVVNEFREKFPIAQAKKNSPNKSLKCQFNIGFNNDLCIHCGRPKRHVDLHGGDCEILVANNK